MFINIKLERSIPKKMILGLETLHPNRKLKIMEKIELFQKLFYKFILCLTNCTGPPLKYL